MATDSLNSLVQQLLAPVAGPDPAGRWMRYEQEFTDIARLREEDNPHLPMGEWERPLVKADWRRVAETCARLLAEDTKDFQIAAWLCDAWIRTTPLEGLCAGIDLIVGMAERYWTAAWPALDVDEADRRVAPFVWMNSHLPLTLRLNIVLLPSALHREAPLTLLDWERAPSADDAKSQERERRSRREIRESVNLADGERLRNIEQGAEQALASVNRLSRFLDAQLKEASPSLSKLTDAIESLQQATHNLLQEWGTIEALSAANFASATTAASGTEITDGTAGSTAPISAMPGAPGAELSDAAGRRPAFTTTSHALHDRQQAYAALVSIAAYLQNIEPHSPTPYLINRAVQLGQMSLPEMIKSVSTSAGSLDKFFELLGISPPR